MLDDAVVSARRAIEINPQAPHLRARLGNLLSTKMIRLGGFHFRAAIELNPTETDFHNGLSHAYTRQGRVDEAIEAARHSVAINASAPHARAHLGNLLVGKRNFVEAEAHLRVAIELDPTVAGFYSGLSNALAHLCKFDEAIQLPAAP